MSEHQLGFRLNGEQVQVNVEASWVLADLLRDNLQRTGTKVGCGVGVCGVCSVLVDGRLQSACLVPAVQLEGRAVVTIEGVAAADGTLSRLQQEFIERGGFQCGICTPGQIMAATALLERYPVPSDEQVREWMTGNLCRCTGYYGILRAIGASATGE